MSDCATTHPEERSIDRGKDAEDHEVSEWGGDLYGKRSNGRRTSGRAGDAVWLRSERVPHNLGPKRSNLGGSRRYQFSRALRSRQHRAKELPSLHPGVDHERTRRELAEHLAKTRYEGFGLPVEEP